MDERAVKWSGLPKELWEVIGKILDSRLDVLRSRSVCSSWRSSIPPFHARFPLEFPDPSGALQPASMSGPPVYLCESTLYLVQPVNHFPTSSSNKGWLMKIQESNSGKFHLLDPLLPDHKYTVAPNTLNLLNFRVVELRKAYVLLVLNAGRNGSIPRVNKVVTFPSSSWTDADEYAVFMVSEPGKLAFGIRGDEKWTLVGDQSVEYDDIIVYKGQLYVVDRWGTVFWIECPSLKLVPFSPPLCGSGSQKHLMESGGALYVVDRYLQWDRRRRRKTMTFYVQFKIFTRTLDFKVYKLDEEGGKWDLLKSLGDRAIVLSTDCCFSVSAQEFVGCKQNCIYFTDEYQRRVFSLEDSSFADLDPMDDSHPFWKAPPTWLSSASP